MRIAVIIESVLHVGGGFQQQLSTAWLLKKHQKNHEFIFYTTAKENLRVLNDHGVPAKYIDVRCMDSGIYIRLSKHQIMHKILRSVGLSRDPFEAAMLHDNIDLVFFLAQSSLAFGLTKTNYMIPVVDLCHRDYPEFPEVSIDREFERREYFYTNAIQKAVAVLVDSELGKANVLRRYGCDGERVFVAKFLPSLSVENFNLVDVRNKYGMQNAYLFYPAQFWAHKNHVYVLEGLNILRGKYGLKIDVVFSGSDKGNLQYVLACARKLGLEEAVHYVGFVPNEDMASLYKQALALVMPTYFGPTNIPPLEAFALSCPVCYSDLPGLRDQGGDAAFLMNLNDPDSMAKQVMTILNDPVAVQKKLQRGKEILAGWTDEDYWNVLNGIFERYARKMRCWKDM